MNPETITLITNISLIAVFVILCVGLAIAMWRGWKKGIWRTCFRMFFIITLLVLAFCLLNTISGALAVIPVDWFGYKSIILTNNSGETYYVSLTTYKETVQEFVKGYYYINHIPYSTDRIIAIANAFSDTTMKMTAVLLSFFMIVTLGNLLGLLLWHIAFKHIVPLIAQKVVKIRWLAMIQNGVTYLLLITLFISPLTSMVNIINQSYQKNNEVVNKNNDIVANASGFLDTYNNSIFSHLFSWSADENGLTFDSKLIGWLTQSSTEYGNINLINELDNIIDLSMYFTQALGQTLTDTLRIGKLFNEVTVNAIFDALEKSELFTMILPVSITVASNLEMVKGKINLTDIDFEQFKYSGEDSENEAIRKVFVDLVNSGIVDEFFTPEGLPLETYNYKKIIEDVVKDEDTFFNVSSALSNIDDSDLLQAVLPSTFLMLRNSNAEAAKYLPATWNEMASIEWGKELKNVLDTVQRLLSVGDSYELLDEVLRMLPDAGGSTPKAEEKRENDGEGEAQANKIVELVFKYAPELREVLVGKETDTHDEYGYTIISSEDVKSNIFDCELMKWMFTPIVEQIGNMMGGAAKDKDRVIRNINVATERLSIPTDWRNKYRNEFANIFDVLEELRKYDNIASILNDFNQVFADIPNIDTNYPGLRPVLTDGLVEMDDSLIFTAIFGPIFEESFANVQAIRDIGLDVDLIKEGILTCSGEDSGYTTPITVGRELGFMVYNITSMGELSKIAKGSNPIDEISKNPDNAMHIANMLDVIRYSDLLNGCSSDKENYFNCLKFIFGKIHEQEASLIFDIDSFRTLDMQWENVRGGTGSKAGFDFDKTILEKGVDEKVPGTNIKYRGENANIGLALFNISKENVVSKLSNISSLKSICDDASRASIKKSLTSAGESAVISKSLGGFLDTKLAGNGLIDDECNFSNVTDWTVEAENLDNLLKYVGKFDSDLKELNLKNTTDIVGLNDLLHSLANSTIFESRDEDGNVEYIFSHWIYQKVTSTLSGNMDLFKDPENWDITLWGDKPGSTDNHYIAKKDFYSMNKLEDWCNDDYEYEFDYSPYGDKTEQNYYSIPREGQLVTFHDGYFEGVDGHRNDELDKLCELVYFVSCEKLDVDNIENSSPDTLEGTLLAINNSTSLRIAIYNAFTKVASTVGSNPDLLNLEDARNEYLINCNVVMGSIADPSVSRSLRKDEIHIVSDLYSLYKETKDKPISNIFAFDEDELLEIKDIVGNMSKSYVYHLQGPLPTSPSTNYTPFQSLISHIYDSDALKQDLFYRSNNSKDANATNYNSYDTKVHYVVKDFYKYGNTADVSAMTQEVSDIFDAFIDMKNFKLSGTPPVIDFAHLSFTSEDIPYIQDALLTLDQTQTMYDVVPNIFYSLFTKNEFSALGKAGGESLLKSANTEFMYTNTYDIYTGSVANPNYTNRVSEQEINRMVSILTNYDALGDSCNFSDLVSLGDKTDNVKSMLNSACDSFMFHEFNNNLNSTTKFTVFEQLVNKIMDESTLSEKSYINTRGYDSASEKTMARIKIVTEFNGVTLDPADPTLDESLREYLTELPATTINWFTNEEEGQIDYIFNFIDTCKELGITNIDSVLEKIQTGTMDPEDLQQFKDALEKIFICKDASSVLIPITE